MWDYPNEESCKPDPESPVTKIRRTFFTKQVTYTVRQRTAFVGIYNRSPFNDSKGKHPNDPGPFVFRVVLQHLSLLPWLIIAVEA